MDRGTQTCTSPHDRRMVPQPPRSRCRIQLNRPKYPAKLLSTSPSTWPRHRSLSQTNRLLRRGRFHRRLLHVGQHGEDLLRRCSCSHYFALFCPGLDWLRLICCKPIRPSRQPDSLSRYELQTSNRQDPIKIPKLNTTQSFPNWEGLPHSNEPEEALFHCRPRANLERFGEAA